MKKVKLKNKIVSNFSKPYFIAEISANHLQKIEFAFKVVEEASKAKADAIKLQTYTPDTMTIKSSHKKFQIDSGTWSGENLYDLYKKAHTPWEWHEKIFNYAESLGLDFFSTPFDETAVDFLEGLNTPFYKVASFEMNHLPLLKKISETKKPIIMSTGMSSMLEIKESVNYLKKNNVKNLILLHCVSGYPTPLNESKLYKFKQLQNNFNYPIGFSDHVLSNEASIAAITLGASVIEKHLTLDRSLGGPDSTFSLEPKELKNLISIGNSIWESLEDRKLKNDIEKENTIFKRSIFVVKDLEEGETFTKDNIKVLRPEVGLKPSEYFNVIGSKARIKIKKNTPLNLEHILKSNNK